MDEAVAKIVCRSEETPFALGRVVSGIRQDFVDVFGHGALRKTSGGPAANKSADTGTRSGRPALWPFNSYTVDRNPRIRHNSLE
ncbi:MAG: hypothetical protein A49_15020 [Methyloceanibacter sp.]|nr:MAG: hypothetical protein A49_15020 [Methyloceanibacter sp.]